MFGFLAILSIAGFAQDQPMKVTHIEAANATATKVQPEYPHFARQLKIEGSVELEALVAENGTVEKVNIVSGNAVLTHPADTPIRCADWYMRCGKWWARSRVGQTSRPIRFTF